MAKLASAGVEWADPALPGSPPGRTTGRVAVRSAFNRRFYGGIDTNIDEAATDFADVTANDGPATAGGALLPSAAVETKLNCGEDWFEKIHVYPGGAIENPNYLQDFKILFGDILAQLDRPFEVFNAYRKLTATLDTITLTGLTPGFETPDTIVTDTIGPLTSMLDSTSTYNVDLTTGLGTPVLRDVRALRDGLSKFDGPMTLGFDLQNVTMNVSGSRVAMVLPTYSMPYVEELGFLTDIIPSSGGKEQRIALRKQPRETFRCKYELDGLERQQFQAIMFEWQHKNFGVPMHHLTVRSTAASVPNATQFQISGADDSDFRVGGLAIVYTDYFTYDIVEISAITDTLLTITGQAVYAYPANTKIIPVRVCRVKGSIKTSVTKFNAMETFSVTYESLDNDTGTQAANTAAWNANTYNSKVLLDDCNIMSGVSIRTELEHNVTILDNQTGIVTTNSAWDTNKRRSVKGFFCQSRAAVNDLKAFLRGVRGRQVSFYLPTFLPDLTVGDDLAIGSTNFDIEHIDYTRFIQSRESKVTFKITFTDGTSLVRVVQSSVDHPTDATLERLTLDTTWPANRTVAEVSRVEFYELVRFNTDDFSIRYSRDGLAKMQAPVIVVFD